MSDSVETAMQEVRDALQRAHEALRSEISNYPTPISGCDAQFNHLLALRSRISSARAAFEADVFVPTSRTPSLDMVAESRPLA